MIKVKTWVFHAFGTIGRLLTIPGASHRARRASQELPDDSGAAELVVLGSRFSRWLEVLEVRGCWRLLMVQKVKKVTIFVNFFYQ